MPEVEHARPPHVAYRKQSYFQSLDGVRFFSIIAVIWHHSQPVGSVGWLSKGFLGVDMFFVLSGYLIVTLLLREKEKGKISLKKFYIRRALRIFPVYFGLLIVLAFLYGVVKKDPQEFVNYLSLLPIYIFFAANWSVVHFPNLAIYWSLATEEQFYLLWPLLEKCFTRKRIALMLFVFICLNQLVNFGVLDGFFLWLYEPEGRFHLSILDSTFTPICLGVALAHLLHRETYFNKIFSLFGNRNMPLILLGILFAAIVLSPVDISGTWRLLIQLSMCLWLGSLVLSEHHIMQPIMVFFPVKRIGQISYGMYVYHMFTLHIAGILLNKLGVHYDYALFVSGTLLTALVAELSFRFYEAPILNFKHKFDWGTPTKP
ncbi:MAG: peptidoglycan/LPS O-acetylase OafA/YrhL [Lentisphaeria bacterium]|jgi:peptidoglycan/LPS O-acetylase OafA/YrhL